MLNTNGKKELDLISGPNPQIPQIRPKNKEMDWYCQNYEHWIQNWRKKWEAVQIEVYYSFYEDITAIFKGYSQKDLGREKKNFNFFNCIVKLETNGPELLRKWLIEVTTTLKITSILNWEEQLEKSINSFLEFFINRRKRLNSTMSI